MIRKAGYITQLNNWKSEHLRRRLLLIHSVSGVPLAWTYVVILSKMLCYMLKLWLFPNEDQHKMCYFPYSLIPSENLTYSVIEQGNWYFVGEHVDIKWQSKDSTKQHIYKCMIICNMHGTFNKFQHYDHAFAESDSKGCAGS